MPPFCQLTRAPLLSFAPSPISVFLWFLLCSSSLRPFPSSPLSLSLSPCASLDPDTASDDVTLSSELTVWGECYYFAPAVWVKSPLTEIREHCLLGPALLQLPHRHTWRAVLHSSVRLYCHTLQNVLYGRGQLLGTACGSVGVLDWYWRCWTRSGEALNIKLSFNDSGVLCCRCTQYFESFISLCSTIKTVTYCYWYHWFSFILFVILFEFLISSHRLFTLFLLNYTCFFPRSSLSVKKSLFSFNFPSGTFWFACCIAASPVLPSFFIAWFCHYKQLAQMFSIKFSASFTVRISNLLYIHVDGTASNNVLWFVWLLWFTLLSYFHYVRMVIPKRHIFSVYLLVMSLCPGLIQPWMETLWGGNWYMLLNNDSCLNTGFNIIFLCTKISLSLFKLHL